MSTNHDDPRLTAYALGELNAADRAAVEQQIGDSVETLLEIESIREVAGHLRGALQSEAALPSAPITVALVNDASPRRKASGKFAVAASCLALAGAFGIVALSGRIGHPPSSRYEDEFAVVDGRMDWLELAQNGTTPLSRRSDYFSTTDADGEAPVEFQSLSDLSADSARGTVVGQASRPALGLSESKSKAHWGLARRSPLFADESIQGRFTRQESAQRGKLKSQSWSDTNGTIPADNRRAESERTRSSVALLAEPLSDEALNGVAAQVARGLPAEERELLRSFGKKTLDDKQLGELEERLKRAAPQEQQVLSKQFAMAYRLRNIRGEELLREKQAEAAAAESYAAIHDNPFMTPLDQPLSTFSIDVDTAAYSNMRRFLTQGSWPPADAVRIEELVNYFSYDYATPVEESGKRKAESGTVETGTVETGTVAANPQPSTLNPQPFAVHLEVAGCPWNAEHRLVRVGLKGREIALDKRPVSNIVFLIDVSGSMQDVNKLPLVKAGLRKLVEQLNENDRVGIVVYAGASGLALDSTNATRQDAILSAIENLQAGGSTNGGEGIQLAYSLARKQFIPKGTNRVILCTDGDFNVGITNQEDLTRLIEEESKSGVFLSVLGFGMGNLKDSTLEKLADKGNGNYAYIDTLKEAHKVFVEQMTGTLITIAKDVKIQIEFNPSHVGAYRLIGYENRVLAAQDFHDDTKDAGEIGAGHTVTALYEIIPPSKLPPVAEPASPEKLKYQPNVKSPAQAEGQKPISGVVRPSSLKPQTSTNPELLTIKLRYKQPDADKSQLLEQSLTDSGRLFAQASPDFRFAASVASFGMILRHSPHRGLATLDAVLELAQSSLGADKSGYRAEFVSLVRSAKALSSGQNR